MKKLGFFFMASLFIVLLVGCAPKEPPTFTGVDNITISVGDEFDLMEGVGAEDSDGDDITNDIVVEVRDVDENIVEFSTEEEFVFYVVYAIDDFDDPLSQTTRVITVVEEVVVDTLPPVITGVEDITLETTDTFDPLDGLSIIDDIDGDITSLVTVTYLDGDGVEIDALYLTLPGITDVVYDIDDNAGNNAKVTITVTVIDVVAPVVVATGLTASNDAPEQLSQYGVATDNVDGDLTSSLTYIVEDSLGNEIVGFPVIVGTYTVTYSVTDSSGNTGTDSMELIIEDHIKPEIVITQDTVYVQYNGVFDLSDYASAVDETDGDISIDIVEVYHNNVPEVISFDTSLPGTYILNLSVTDAAGNLSSGDSSYGVMTLIVGSDIPVAFDLEEAEAETLITEFYYDVFESTLTPNEVCAKYMTDIPFLVDTPAGDCEDGLPDILSMFYSFTVDAVVEETVDGEIQYVVTVTLTMNDESTITFDAIMNFLGYEYSDEYYLNFISSPFELDMGMTSIAVGVVAAEAALDEYYTKLIDNTYDVTDFCNNYVMNTVTNEALLSECIAGVTNLRAVITGYQINSMIETTITPPEGDPFVGYMANVTLTTTTDPTTFDLYMAFFNTDGTEQLNLFGSPMGEDHGGGGGEFADIDLATAETLIDAFYDDLMLMSIVTADFCVLYGVLNDDMTPMDAAQCLTYRTEVLTHAYLFETGVLEFTAASGDGPPVFIMNMSRTLDTDTIAYQAMFFFMVGPDSTVYLMTPGNNATGELNMSPGGDGPAIANIDLTTATTMITEYYENLMDDTITDADFCNMYFLIASTMEPLNATDCISERASILSEDYTFTIGDIEYFDAADGSPPYFQATITATNGVATMEYNAMFIFIVGSDSNPFLATQLLISAGHEFSLKVAAENLTLATTLIGNYYADLFNDSITTADFCNTWILNNTLYIGTEADCIEGRNYALSRSEIYTLGVVSVYESIPFVTYQITVTATLGGDSVNYNMTFFITTDGTEYFLTLMHPIVIDVPVS